MAKPRALVSVLTSRDRQVNLEHFLQQRRDRAARDILYLPRADRAILLIGQGETDALVLPAAQAEYVKLRCVAGRHLEYCTCPGWNYVPLFEPDSELSQWTKGHLAGMPTPPNCQGNLRGQRGAQCILGTGLHDYEYGSRRHDGLDGPIANTTER